MRRFPNALLVGFAAWLLMPMIALAQGVVLVSTTQVAAGADHGCALTTAGGVQCWGFNAYGQLGDGTHTDSDTPVAVSGLSSGVAAITAGYYNTCELTTVGGVLCWGSNSNGQLGDGTNTDRATPLVVNGLSSGLPAIAAMSAGSSHTCALTTGGGMLCWGSNFFGALGNGTATDSVIPGAGAVSGLSSGVAAIEASVRHTCALTTAGGVQCWGNNNEGQLGNGTNTNSNMPVAVSGLSSGVAAISSTFGLYSCALTTAGGVLCWGLNDHGQLGNGTTTNSTTPVAVTSLGSGVAAISTGENHTCALTTSGGVQCWGLNDYGQLGNGTTTDSTTPVAVTNLGSGVAAISMGQRHTCALTMSGGVQCWGADLAGALGDGTIGEPVFNPTPAAVVGLSSGVEAISSGVYYTCALTTSGGVQCWGELPNSVSGERSATPVAVSGLSSGVAAITAGGFHLCALTTADAMQCVGYNSSGQLGNGTTTSTATPVPVVAGQAIGFAPSQHMAAGDSVTLVATASGGNAVSFDSWTPDTCTVSGDQLVLTNPGLCGVRASQTGGIDAIGDFFAAAPQQLRLIQIADDRIFANGFEVTGVFNQ